MAMRRLARKWRGLNRASNLAIAQVLLSPRANEDPRKASDSGGGTVEARVRQHDGQAWRRGGQ